jgi:hypothetical protein
MYTDNISNGSEAMKYLPYQYGVKLQSHQCMNYIYAI